MNGEIYNHQEIRRRFAGQYEFQTGSDCEVILALYRSLTPSPSPKGEGSDYIESSECCKIPRTNREFWVAKIRRNQERDREELRKLAEMGWHCITVWECELKPSRREETLDSIAFTLNHIWLQDRARMQGATEPQVTPYYIYEDGDLPLPMAAENMEDVIGKMDDGLSSTDRFADVSKMIE